MNWSKYFLIAIIGSTISLGVQAQIFSPTQTVSQTPRITDGSPGRPPVPQGLPVDACLTWDSVNKAVTVSNGTPEAHFTFYLTNISPDVVVISSVGTSCGCTAAKLPEQPWHLAAGSNGEINVTMNLAGKMGTVPKTVTVNTEKNGSKTLFVRTTILPSPVSATMGGMNPIDRNNNQKLAMADRQAVFRGDCARCHVEPTKNKMGAELFATACGVCHEGEQRASMVPNLHALPKEKNAEYWRTWITYGRPGSLMPAFSKEQGGIFDDAQIASLVGYLMATIPQAAAPPAPAIHGMPQSHPM
jgi:mono/diheme cytochrome c family protein